MSRISISKGWIAWSLVTAVALLFIMLAAGRGSVSATDSASYAASSLPNPPAVTQASLLADIASWPAFNGSVDGVTYSFRYPPTWNSDLMYCAQGAAKELEGAHLPANCASTDLLVGQKARDIGLLQGQELTVGGKSARRAISGEPANVLVSRIYTALVYDAAGTPLFGFSTQIGADTNQATLDEITALLDAMLGTVKVGAAR